MSGTEIILALAAGLAAVWYGLYAMSLVWLARRYARFTVASSNCLARAVRIHSRASLVESLDALFALAWSTSLALVLTPLLLIVVPLFLGIGALAITGALIHVHG